MDLKSTYNLIAEDWDRDHLQDDWWIAGTNTFMSFLRPGVHILDAGCAGGIKAEALIGIKEVFDAVFLQAVLLHFPKKDAPTIIRSLAAKIKPGGYFYIAVKEIRPGGKEEEVVHEEDYGYDYARFFSYYSVDEIEKYLADANFEVVYASVLPAGKTNWIQVIGRKL